MNTPALTRHRASLAGVLLTALLLSGCGARPGAAEPGTGTALPAPTVASLFQSPQPTLPEPTQQAPTATPRPAGGPAGPTPTAAPDVTVGVYDEQLAEGWSLEQSQWADLELDQQGVVDAGEVAIKASPNATTAVIFFTLRPDADLVLRRDEVLGLRFRLSGGDMPIANDAMVVTVVGSNSQPFWVANDTSVELDGRVTDDSPLFSETRLYYLDINRSIPAGTWTDVVVWLDELIYDPDYTYVTGFYLKTEKQYLDYFYLDQIEFVLQPGSEPRNAAP